MNRATQATVLAVMPTPAGLPFAAMVLLAAAVGLRGGKILPKPTADTEVGRYIAQTSRPALDPEWVRPMPAGIEWAELAGRGETLSLLVATRDARLHLIAPASGTPSLEEPIAVGRGVRPAGGRTAAAYCFDRYAAYALRVEPPAGLKWQWGERPAEGQEFPDDPETLTGWRDGQAADAGLLLLNRDGRLVLLSATDGRVCWEIELGSLALARLHVLGRTAVVLSKAGGQVKLAFINLNEEHPRPAIRDAGDTWPVWSKLLDSGLLTASPGQVTLWPRDGPAHDLHLPSSAIRPAAMAVFVGSDHQARSGPVLLIADGARPAAYDVLTGARLWPTDAPPSGRADIRALAVCGNRCVAATESGVCVCDAITGAELASFDRPARTKLLAWHLSGDVLYALCRESDDPETPLHLVRAELRDRADSQPETGGPAEVRLGACADLRQALWADGRLVLVEPDGLRAYKLP
jgi:hypothetical protein